jgi:hypothetical protein
MRRAHSVRCQDLPYRQLRLRINKVINFLLQKAFIKGLTAIGDSSSSNGKHKDLV